jgi:hypothetical protein
MSISIVGEKFVRNAGMYTLINQIPFMLSTSEVEQFIHNTFSLCFRGRSCTRTGHVQDQQNYLLGVIETLHRRGDITEDVREFYRLQYYEGKSFEGAAEHVFSAKDDMTTNL